MNIRELRVGSHVLCGSIYRKDGEEFKIPQHYAEVVSVGADWVCTVVDSEQGDPDEYSPEEVDGIPFTDDVLLRMGFERIEDGINGFSRYRNDTAIIYLKDEVVGILVGEKSTMCDRPSYLHTLEGMLLDMGYEPKFDPYGSKS